MSTATETDQEGDRERQSYLTPCVCICECFPAVDCEYSYSLYELFTHSPHLPCRLVLPSPPFPRRWNLSLASFSMFVSHKSQQSTHTHTHTSVQTEARKWYGIYETCCAIVEEFGLVSGNRRRKKWVAALGFVWGFFRLIDSVANSFVDRSDD